MTEAEDLLRDRIASLTDEQATDVAYWLTRGRCDWTIQGVACALSRAEAWHLLPHWGGPDWLDDWKDARDG